MNPLSPLAPYAALFKLGAIALLLGFVFFGGRSCGKQAGNAEVSALKASHAQTLQGIAEQTAKAAELSRLAAEKLREREQAQAQKFVDIAIENQARIQDAQAKADAVVTDLRAGNLRLRYQWQGCMSTSRIAAEAGASTRGADAEADLRSADIGRVHGVGLACDAHVESLQAVLIAERAP